jgi:hypothetical protein
VRRAIRGTTPPTVASAPGGEAEKLLQRFAQLNAANKARLLDMAGHMIEHERDATLPPREREAKKLIDRIERCLELIATEGGGVIERRVWRGLVDGDKARLAALGIHYFGAGDSRPKLVRRKAA